MSLSPKNRAAIIIILCSLYATTYWAARSSHWLIHRTGYYSETDHGQKMDGHYITQGYFGTPMLAPLISTAQGVATILLWPAAQVELVYWDWTNHKVLRGNPANPTLRSRNTLADCRHINGD